MKRISGAILLASAGLIAENRELSKGSAFNDQVHFSYSTMLEPSIPGQTVGIAGGMYVDEGFHRVLKDKTQKKYFGYDVAIEAEGTDLFRVRIQPLSSSAVQLGIDPSWTLVPLPRVPGPQSVPNGGKIALELMVNPSTGQKIVDYLTIQGPERSLAGSARPARDYTVEDVSLSVNQPRVTVNGKLVPDTANLRGAVIGPVVFFQLPDRGRFALSLAPNAAHGFQRAGEVRGSDLTVRWGQDEYVLNCNGRIAPGPGRYHIYVRHDPGLPSAAGFAMGATSAAMLTR